jgi:hypothetical protein
MAFCLGPSLLGFRTLLSVDELTYLWPWMAAKGSIGTGHEQCSGDTINSVMPGIAAVRNAVFDGHLAAWQSYVGGGSALFAVPDLGLLDPLSLPYWILPLRIAPAFVVLLSFLAAVGGTFGFLRLLRVSRAAATLAGLVFATSGFMVMWTNWPQTRVAALVPALFWATERLIQKGRIRDAMLIAAVVASMAFGGFPQVTAYGLYLAAGYLIVRVIAKRVSRHDGVRTLGLALGGLILGLGVAMVQMLPFLYFFQHGDLAYRSANNNSHLPFTYLVTTVAPNAYGLCVNGQRTLGAQSPVEFVSYIGAAAVVLALVGIVTSMVARRTEAVTARWYFVLATVVILVLGWGSLSALSLVEHLPGFSGNFIGRIRAVLGFAVAVLAALGFDAVTRPSARQRGEPQARPSVPRLVWTVGTVIVVGALGVAALVKGRRFVARDHYIEGYDHRIWIPLLLVLATLVIVVVVRLGAKWTTTAAFVILPVLVAAQGAQYFHTVLPGDSNKAFYPITGTHAFLDANLGHERYASSEGTMLTATSLYYGLRTPTGHTFLEPQWQGLLQAVDPAVMQSPTYAEFTANLNAGNAGHEPILDAMGVKYFVTDPGGLVGDFLPVPAADGQVRGQTVSCTVSSQPMRGITFKLVDPLVSRTVNTGGVSFHATFQDGSQRLAVGRYIGGEASPGPVSIALPGQDLPTGGTATFTLSVTGTSDPLVLAGSGGTAACAPVLPTDDGLKLVYADSGSIIYQRLAAMPRIRWESQSTYIASPTAQLAAMRKGLPANRVLLDSPGPAAAGLPATVKLEADDGDEVRASVDSSGRGYLLVADPIQQGGWSVTVDGKTARLMPADYAMGAVAVPAGVHQVAFRYRAPDQRLGAAITLISLLTVAGLLVWERRRLRRRPEPVPAGPTHGER